MSVRNQKRLQEIYALLFLAFSLILLLALISYHPADPSFNSFSAIFEPIKPAPPVTKYFILWPPVLLVSFCVIFPSPEFGEV